MCFPYLGTHIPSDMCSPTQGCQNAPATSIIAGYFEVFGSSKWLEKSKKKGRLKKLLKEIGNTPGRKRNCIKHALRVLFLDFKFVYNIFKKSFTENEE